MSEQEFPTLEDWFASGNEDYQVLESVVRQLVHAEQARWLSERALNDALQRTVSRVEAERKELEKQEPVGWAYWDSNDLLRERGNNVTRTEPRAYPNRAKLYTHPAPDILKRVDELEAENSVLRKVRNDGADGETIARMIPLRDENAQLKQKLLFVEGIAEADGTLITGLRSDIAQLTKKLAAAQIRLTALLRSVYHCQKEHLHFHDDDCARIKDIEGFEELNTLLSAARAEGIEEGIERAIQVCMSKEDAEYATGKVDHNEMSWCRSCAEAIRSSTHQ